MLQRPQPSLSARPPVPADAGRGVWRAVPTVSRSMAVMLGAVLSVVACSGPLQAAVDVPAPDVDLVADPPAQDEGTQAQVVLAGGCFWCTEVVFEELRGVGEVVSGYAGGSKDDADYQKVSAGLTDHAEVIRVSYDPSVISYGTLLRVFFAVAHNPTHVDRQGNDRGPQYRSAVFYDGEEQKRVAQAYIAQINAAEVFDKPIATRMEPLTVFYPAEDYHQDYARLNPRQGYVAGVALPKVEKLHKQFADLLKPQEK